MLRFWGTKTFGRKNFAGKNRVVQGDRVIQGRVIEGGLLYTVFIVLPPNKARQIITAGGRGEKVIEKSEWGHSAFTKNLLSGLVGMMRPSFLKDLRFLKRVRLRRSRWRL